MNILSVDWDYFFPNSFDYDWGHKETPFFLDAIWPFRAGHRNMCTGELATKAMRPRPEFREFWDRVVDGSPAHLVIVESHADMLEILRLVGPSRVVNFDAHHDLGYGETEELECGNWALHGVEEGLIEGYELYYPEWRYDSPESVCEDGWLLHGPEFGLPKEPEHFDLIFICRSSAWTPSWSDDDWLEFIEHWSLFPCWERKTTVPFVMTARSLTLAKAEALAAENAKNYALLRG